MAAAILPPPAARGQGAGPRLGGGAAGGRGGGGRALIGPPPRAGPAPRRPQAAMAAEPLPGGPAEPNPFSFREFVRSKARGGDGAGADTQAAWAGPAVPPLPAVPAEPGDEQEDEEEEEEEWSESYQPLAVEQAHLGSAGAAPGPGRVPPRQPSYEQLKEENAILRSKINKLQILSETQADKLRKLEKKLEENKIKEEKEAQDLEAMVQHVEQNLQLMTKRAAKAESSAARLRQENAQLQAAALWGRVPAARG
ncbi:endosome-associated-trafficking regulator 1 isoform X2 [Motacilla alba alba]|uniref:endosome-associated-trafficking regulator 1 isoform X2 n=1 Tax=Motacilla alba alba TaxID=1094192 RepID=UPI0018D584EC|nr:endosome-associated-trafficking regulator 1 isoform X2 [Motacilla alba alba]